MTNVGVKVTGARELRRAARKAESDGARKALKESHKEAAGRVAPKARKKAPRQSGRLARSVRPLGSVTKAQVAAGGARAPHAGPIHYGWPKRNIRKQTFLADAVAEEYDDIRKLMEARYHGVAQLLETN